MQALGIARLGFTPACIRPGKATELFEEFRDVAWVRRHLRHVHLTSTDRYLQEVGAAGVRARIPRSAWTLVSRVNKRADIFVSGLAALLEARVWLPVTGRTFLAVSGPAGSDSDSDRSVELDD